MSRNRLQVINMVSHAPMSVMFLATSPFLLPIFSKELLEVLFLAVIFCNTADHTSHLICLAIAVILAMFTLPSFYNLG